VRESGGYRVFGLNGGEWQVGCKTEGSRFGWKETAHPYLVGSPSDNNHINGSMLSAFPKHCAALRAMLQCRAGMPAFHCTAGSSTETRWMRIWTSMLEMVDNKSNKRKNQGRRTRVHTPSPACSIAPSAKPSLHCLPCLPPPPKLHTAPRFHL
jgi:hypothetical protein